MFGDKWTLLIIRDMVFFNKRSYNEFLTSEEKISTNVLADRLNMLEKEQFITKGKDKEHKQKIIYSLTEKAIDLLPVIIEIGLWSDKYALEIPPSKEDVILGESKKDKIKAFIDLKKKLYAIHVLSAEE